MNRLCCYQIGIGHYVLLSNFILMIHVLAQNQEAGSCFSLAGQYGGFKSLPPIFP